MEAVQNNSRDEKSARAGRRARGWYERIKPQFGLEGKILAAITLLLMGSLAGTCWVWVSQTQSQVVDLMSEQVRQVANALALAGKPAMEGKRVGDLQLMGRESLKARNILFVAFYNANAESIAFEDLDPDYQSTLLPMNKAHLESLGRVAGGHSPRFGDYLEICAPVFSGGEEKGAATRLIGYVAVGVSTQQEQAQVRRVIYFAAGIGCVIVLLGLPLAYAIVHRIFWPIRKLVEATNQIAAGDLDAHVDIDRQDAIGTLGRSFNEMAKTVKRQRGDLQKANQDLEIKVTQRTGQLETANKRLSSEIAEKEDFLRAVSHDLNAPLRNISGMAAMLLMKHKDQFDADIVHRLERIQKNVEVETDLIGELLELSRIKTRRQKMDMVETTALVVELGEMFENDLKTRQISLVVDGRLPVLHGERARFRQVFQNLIDNAIKYMGDPGAREIHVGCEMKGEEAQFYVRDTGMGIDPEDLSKIFCIFRRGKNPAAREVPGKGVGLSSVKSIIETYGGTIWVESQLGQGSTFFFTISGQYVPSITAGAETPQPVQE